MVTHHANFKTKAGVSVIRPLKHEKRKLKKMHNKKGSVLFESLIAITIITVGLLGMFSLMTKSLGLTKVISDRYVAANLASEGIEIIKNLIDTNILKGDAWNKGLGPGGYEVAYNMDINTIVRATGHALLYNAATGLYGYAVGSETAFKRDVVIDWPIGSPDEMQVNSIVKWVTRGGLQFELNVEDHFYNWR